jgi:hypothetical protein
MNDTLITIMLFCITAIVAFGSVSAIIFLWLLTWQMIEDNFL